MSSYAWAQTIIGDGILSDQYSNNPQFSQTNHVYLKQCSSDGWTGQAPVINGSYYFQGSNIFKLIIADLKTFHGLTLATRVLFSGSSSGSQGVLQHLDWLTDALPQAQVKGVIDAGYFVDTLPLDTALDRPSTLAVKYIKLHHTFIDLTCQSAYPTNPEQCLLPENIMPYITTPLMVRQSLYDRLILEKFGSIEPYSPSAIIYNTQYAALIKNSMLSYPVIYLNNDKSHSIMDNSAFFKKKIRSINFQDYLSDWFYLKSNVGQLIE